jgi:hypothetical protein
VIFQGVYRPGSSRLMLNLMRTALRSGNGFILLRPTNPNERRL